MLTAELFGLHVTTMSLMAWISTVIVTLVSFAVSGFYSVRVMRHSTDPFRYALLGLLLAMGMNNLPLAIYGLGVHVPTWVFFITRIVSSIVIVWLVVPLIVESWRELCSWIGVCSAKFGLRHERHKYRRP